MQHPWMLVLALAGTAACATEQSCWQDDPVKIDMDQETPIGTPSELRELALGERALDGTRWDEATGDVTVTIESAEGDAFAIEAGRDVRHGFKTEMSLLICEETRIEVPVEVLVETWFETSFRLAGVVKGYERLTEDGDAAEPRLAIAATELLEVEGAENLPGAPGVEDLRASAVDDWGGFQVFVEHPTGDPTILLSAQDF